jgi:hypothetical protein
VVDDSLVPVDGAIRVRRPEVDPGLLERWSADERTSAVELDRLSAAEALQ